MKKRKLMLLMLPVLIMAVSGCGSKADVKIPETVIVTGDYFNVTSTQLINDVNEKLTDLHGSEPKWETVPEEEGYDDAMHFWDIDDSSYLVIICDIQTDYIMKVSGLFDTNSPEADFDESWMYMSILSDSLNPEGNTAAIKKAILEDSKKKSYVMVESADGAIIYTYVILEDKMYFTIRASN